MGNKLFEIIYLGLLEEETLNLTSRITVPSYEVNNLPVYEEWKDGNRIERRDIIRYQISGSFTLMFFNKNQYLDFISTYNMAKDDERFDGTVEAKVYINNEDRVVRTRVYMDFEISNQLPIIGMEDADGIEVTIKER